MEVYNSSLTRNQFFFYEIRVVAGLICEGLTDAEILEKVWRENLFQFPTERSIKRICRYCLERLACVNDEELTQAIAQGSFDVARQAALYSYLKYSRLLYAFWLRLGEKYQTGDDSFSKRDIRTFFSDLEADSEQVCGWSETTKNKIMSVILKTMTDTGYLDKPDSERLNPVYLFDEVRTVMERQGERKLLPAFNAWI